MTEDRYRPHRLDHHLAPRPQRIPELTRMNAELFQRAEAVSRGVSELEAASRGAVGDGDVKSALKAASATARGKGHMLSLKEYHQITDAYRLRISPFEKVYYKEANAIASSLRASGPDIDEITDTMMRPGRGATLFGTGFGPPQGRVLAEIAANTCIELRITEWSETAVTAYVDPIVANTPLRPYYGKIWLQTGAGATSNIWPMQYSPIYSEYYAAWRTSIRGYGGGNHADDTFLRECRLDNNFSIVRMERSHHGSGWSELRWPHAQGQSMEQGYHIGVGGFGRAEIEIAYAVSGPKGIEPTYFEDLGPWGYIGDLG